MQLDGINIMQVPPYIRVPEAKTYFGLGERTVLKLLANNEIIGSKKAKQWLISSASIFKLLKKHQNIRKEV